MLSFLKLLAVVILMAVLLWIGLQNVEQRVDISLSPIGQYLNLSLALVLFYAYVAGLLTFGIVHLIQNLKLRTQLSRLRRENRKINDELHQLRSITLEDLPRDAETDSPS